MKKSFLNSNSSESPEYGNLPESVQWAEALDQRCKNSQGGEEQ